MADGTHIEWTGATWNVITGCMIKSPGCLRCYAMKLAGTRLQHHPSRVGLTTDTKTGPVWTGEVRFNEQWLDQPLRWKRPRDIFVVAHGDLAYERVTDEMLDRVFAVVALAHWHRFQILTKRPDRLALYLKTRLEDFFGHLQDTWNSTQCEVVGQILTLNRERQLAASMQCAGGRLFPRPAPNIWIGTSVERQQEADERRPHLEALARMGWNTWVSYEPALGPVDWSGWEFIRWMVSGGESGPDARPSHPEWHRATRDWCAANEIPYFFKQWGSWAPHKPAAGGDLGGDVRSGRVTIVHPTGQTDVEVFNETGINTIRGSRYMALVGKKAAGALLDGVAHKAMPHG